MKIYTEIECTYLTIGFYPTNKPETREFVMNNQEEYSQDLQKEVRKLKQLLAGKTALAWMGMSSSVWRHSIEGDIIAIRNSVFLIREFLLKNEPTNEIYRYLEFIEQATQRILDRPIAPPIMSDERVTNINVNEILKEQITHLQEDYKLANINVILQLEAIKSTSVKVSLVWLRYCLEILLENAVEAMQESTTKTLIITTKQVHERVEIHIQDSGKGISPDILPLLFIEPIRDDRAKMGRGLLIANSIAEAFEGKIYVLSTSSRGSTLVLELPLSV